MKILDVAVAIRNFVCDLGYVIFRSVRLQFEPS